MKINFSIICTFLIVTVEIMSCSRQNFYNGTYEWLSPMSNGELVINDSKVLFNYPDNPKAQLEDSCIQYKDSVVFFVS